MSGATVLLELLNWDLEEEEKEEEKEVFLVVFL
jgi:hypothetical protein